MSGSCQPLPPGGLCRPAHLCSPSELQARCEELETDKRGCLAQLLQLTAYCKHLMEVNHSVNSQLSQLTASLGTSRGWLHPPLTATQAPLIPASLEAGISQLGGGRLCVGAGTLPLPMPPLDLPGLGDYLGLSSEASACPVTPLLCLRTAPHRW